MGKKKKFIDKKKSATFQLLARDFSDPNFSTDTPGGDRVFVRVDNNPVTIGVFEDQNVDESRFADAPNDDDEGGDEYDNALGIPTRAAPSGPAPLADPVRREILELGFPDDGYNYLIHLREIKNTGGGSFFYHNPKFTLDQISRDVKAYDASKVNVSAAEGDHKEKSIYSVASKTVDVRVQKAVDPEVAALLDDSDLSRFGSDVEDLDEDFVVRANMLDKGETAGGDEKLNSSVEFEGLNEVGGAASESGGEGVVDWLRNQEFEAQPRVRRLLDEQFDMLELKEYGTGSEDDYNGYLEEEEILMGKLKDALKDQPVDDLELGDAYKAPADFLHGDRRPESKELLDSAADVIRRCAEYAEKYWNESGSEIDVLQESSDESEQWDCETIVSTYSNLDNHPGKIEAPIMARKKKLAETVSGALNATNPVISLRGKEKIPVDFLPCRRATSEKVKDTSSLKIEQKRKQHGQESKDEKKERKAAVKEERREARRLKKEMKGLYKFEAQRAQRVAAVAEPSSIHLL